ncbi:hypothetical protein P153DRAFT_361995 [Dothidotthia symphoricarpi CBS 119687]|uniref:Transcription factor domain-containing protein n=1 Tax=Dothidotthia symphoricarpi CBS 119687 TaxID=1392245 RepID=A0A6A5ZYH2_9PLEO|nr:uncharacterized protein P153DRAFT_361995 [Dothidotthia symphoricarpi CBS 119687]KAF2123428.1 hypothetical protein P153DRAFT_361995 [Dothidotthia symphoricarpi CBS 119687]
MLNQLAAAIDLQRPSAPSEPSIYRALSDEPSTTQSSRDPATQSSPTFPVAEPNSMHRCMQDLQLPEAVISEGIELYFANHCNQPCPILAYSGLLEPKPGDLLPPIILYPMLALSLRSCGHSFFSDKTEIRDCLTKLTQLSWELLCKAYCAFDIDDAYFQGLCLLAQVDSGDGRSDRARAQVALGLRLAQGSGMLGINSLNGLELADRARRQEIVWSLFMLDRMLLGGNTRDPSSPITAFELPVIQGGPSHPDILPQLSEVDISLSSVESGVIVSPQSAVCLQVQIIRIWECVMANIAQPPSSTDVPLWRHDSPRAAILTRLLDFQMRCETAGHSLSCTGSPTRVLEEPGLANYFLIWLRFQLIHCVINCCLNHPFIIHIKTIKLEHRVPLTFLQKSYEFSLIHANWVFRLLNDMDDAGLVLHDPFIGHIVAIAASIHLEHTISQYPTVAASAKQKFEKCLGFVRGLSQEWPNMQVTASLLEQLQLRIRHRSNMNSVEEEYDGAAPPNGARQVHLEEEDLQLMWRLFDFASTSTKLHADYALDEEWAPDMTIIPQNADDVPIDMDFHIPRNPHASTGMLVQATNSSMPNIAVGSIYSFGTFDIPYGD